MKSIEMDKMVNRISPNVFHQTCPVHRCKMVAIHPSSFDIEFEDGSRGYNFKCPFPGCRFKTLFVKSAREVKAQYDEHIKMLKSWGR